MKTTRCLLLSWLFVYSLVFGAQDKPFGNQYKMYLNEGVGYTNLVVLLKEELSTLEARANSRDSLQKLKSILPQMVPLVVMTQMHTLEDLHALQRHRLTRYFQVDTRHLSPAQANVLIAQVRKNPLVEDAQFDPPVDNMHMDNGAPIKKVKTTTLPDYNDKQNYLQGRAAVSPYKIGGVNAVEAWKVVGGRGDDIRVISVEIDNWSYDHVDLPSPFMKHWNDKQHVVGSHDTASVGIIASQENSFGTTGIAPRTRMGYSKYEDAAGLYDLAQYLHAGDVIQLGVHLYYFSNEFPGVATCTPTVKCYMPVEWDKSVRDVIAYLTEEKGVHVVIAAANGNINLDHPFFKGYFDRNIFDSGAIYVGAVDPKTGLKAGFSEYGRRVDLFSWGRAVTTTTWSTDNPTTAYTHRFSGTSSANPILAGVVASLQGVARAHDLGNIPPKMLRKILVDTGYPQMNGNSIQIGVQPDLDSAIKKLLENETNPPPTGRLAIPNEVNSGETFSAHVYAESPAGKQLTYHWNVSEFMPATGTAASLSFTAPMVTSKTRSAISVEVSDGQHTIELTENIMIRPKLVMPTPVTRIMDRFKESSIVF